MEDEACSTVWGLYANSSDAPCYREMTSNNRSWRFDVVAQDTRDSNQPATQPVTTHRLADGSRGPQPAVEMRGSLELNLAR